MCHHLIVGMADGLDMYYGTRQQWWNEVLVRQPQGFCTLAVMANAGRLLKFQETM